MTRKDYILIAGVIAERVRTTHPSNSNRLSELAYVARDMAIALKRDNPNFNATLFFNACRVPEFNTEN
jgi:hypothetical protein